jgi:hypothetical protein
MRIVIVLTYALLLIAGCFSDEHERYVFHRDGARINCEVKGKSECGFHLTNCSDKREYNCVKTLEMIEMPIVGEID